MPTPTPITKPTPLDFTQEKVEIGDTVEFIDKINRMQAELATFSSQLNAMVDSTEQHNNDTAANVAADNRATAQAVASSNQQTAQAVAASAAQFIKATKAQAEAGTDNANYMTSLRVKEHVEKKLLQKADKEHIHDGVVEIWSGRAREALFDNAITRGFYEIELDGGAVELMYIKNPLKNRSVLIYAGVSGIVNVVYKHASPSDPSKRQFRVYMTNYSGEPEQNNVPNISSIRKLKLI